MISTASTMNVIDITQRKVGHIYAKPKPTTLVFVVTHAPNCGPTNINATPAMSNPPITSINPSAINRVFHHGRVSGMSYATFNASIRLANPPTDAQRVPKTPNVNTPALFTLSTSFRTARTSPMLSGGTTRDIAPTTRSNRSADGNKPRIVAARINSGNSDMTKK